MSKISRIHLANCGFRTAWYEAVTFDLTEPGTGLPTDTIINLENGGGKTTLLGLVFSCFETSKERFLKHIQSKHNNFSQYFTQDGVPGFIVIEWLMPARSTNGQPYKLVTGQAVSVRTTAETDVDRMFFSFEERDDLRLEDIPASGLSCVPALSMNDFSRWIHEQQKKHSGNVFISHNRQAEWQRHLKDERLIDLDMLRMQVNFSAEEGGFDTGFLDFKTESEFLRKFLFLTSDATRAEEARRSVVSVCELHRRKPQLQRRRDQLKKFRISLSMFADVSHQYIEAMGTQRTMLINGVQYVQALQARANEYRRLQETEIAFEKEQRNQAAAATKDGKLFATELTTGTWVWYQKRVTQAKMGKDNADQSVLGLERKSKLLKAARLQQEILNIDERIKELEALVEAEMAELKPARDHVDIQGALLRRALFNEEARLKEELAALDSRSKLREESKTNLRIQKVKADADELRLTREQTGLQTAEDRRNVRRIAMERDGIFVSSDESADTAIDRHEAATARHQHERDFHFASRDTDRSQANELRTKANEERISAASFDEQAKGQQTYISRGEAELERLGRLPALLSAVETDRVDPQSPALLPRLQDVITDSNRQKSLAEIRLAELHATRQAIKDTGVADYSHDVSLVVQVLQAAGIRSAKPFNEYIAHTIVDVEKAQALVLSDPARYSGVCVAQAEFGKANSVSWNTRKPGRPVIVSIAALDTITAQDGRLVVPPEDASAFNIAAAIHLASSLDSRLHEERQRCAAYELRHSQTLKAAQELDTFAAVYGNGQLAEAAVKHITLEKHASTMRNRAVEFEAEALTLNAKAQQHDKSAEEQEKLRSVSAQATQMLRQFETEYEAGREGRLERLIELDEELAETRERKTELDIALDELQHAHDTDHTKRADTDVALRLSGEERARIIYYNKEYPAQEQLQRQTRSLTTLRDLYEDARSHYLTEEKDRLGSLSERIHGVKEQRIGKTKEFTRDYSGVTMADLKPYLTLDHEAGLRTVEEQLNESRKEQVQASGQHQALTTESSKWYALNKQSIGTATAEFERRSVEELAPLIDDLKQKTDRASERMRAANEEANHASNRAQEKLRAAELDEQNETTLRIAMNLSDQPDPALIAAEIGALMGKTPEVPERSSLILDLNSSKQVNALLKEYNSKNAGVSKLQTAAHVSFDSLKNAAADPTFREVDPDVALQMMQNDFTAACTEALRLLEHLDDRISTTESTLNGMQADFDTCVEEVLGVVRSAINTLNKACSPEKCVPMTAPYVGGKQVLKMRANFAAVTLDMRRAAMHNYLDILADTLAIPAKGTDLIADAVARVYGKPLGLHVLKMSIEESEQYVPVEKISNSGGEGVVMAMFLYLVINQLRAENHAQVKKSAGGPLILDNPFAKATTAALWRAQRLLASAMNVQLIFATALQDFNSIGEFQRFIRLRKAGQNTKTKRWHLEVAHLQLSDSAEEVMG